MPTVTPKKELPRVFFVDAAAYEAWLEAAYASSERPEGLWIRFAKKGSGVASLTYAEAVEVSLAWGFIDGQSKGVDEKFFDQRYTPRGPKSMWSKINREKIAALEAAGRMREPGRREVERAKADGRWDAAYDPPSRVAVPDDLRRALDASPRAKAAFEQLDSTNRYAILHRLQVTKTAASREKSLIRYVEMLARGETLHPMKVAASRGEGGRAASKATAPKKAPTKKPAVANAVVVKAVVEKATPKRSGGASKRKST